MGEIRTRVISVPIRQPYLFPKGLDFSDQFKHLANYSMVETNLRPYAPLKAAKCVLLPQSTVASLVVHSIEQSMQWTRMKSQ